MRERVVCTPASTCQYPILLRLRALVLRPRKATRACYRKLNVLITETNLIERVADSESECNGIKPDCLQVQCTASACVRENGKRC